MSSNTETIILVTGPGFGCRHDGVRSIGISADCPMPGVFLTWSPDPLLEKAHHAAHDDRRSPPIAGARKGASPVRAGVPSVLPAGRGLRCARGAGVGRVP